MLSKSKIDKKLKKYIKEHLSKGYTKQAVKHVLVNHGYNEPYVDGLLKKHSEIQFVKKYAMIVSLLVIFSAFSLNFVLTTNPQQKISGYATVLSTSDEGCCISICQQTSRNECYGNFAETKKCSALEDCNVGCCIDKEGYCLTNYLHGNCLTGYGTSINKECSDIVFCRNLTDKSYSARQYNIKNKKGAGFSVSNPNADYYKSSFNIRYYLYDKTDVVSVAANIIDKEQVIDSIALYDDGSHNDGARNDNLYGNNWLSSKISDFEGFKKLDIDVTLGYADGTQQSIENAQSIVVLNNNKCMPIYTEWSSLSQKRSIIFAADNYENLNDGYAKFQGDARNFLNVLFSINKFYNSKDKFNIYRLDQSLSYFNMPTLINVVSSYCPSYSNKKDLVVVLDNSEDYCVIESVGVLRVNPNVLFYKNITNAEINETFASFCNYVLTPKKLADEILNFATPPRIIVQTLDNITYNAGFVNLSFSVSASNYPVNYSVFLENLLVLNQISIEEASESIGLNLANGTNAVLIEARDKNENTAFAQILLNVTLQ